VEPPGGGVESVHHGAGSVEELQAVLIENQALLHIREINTRYAVQLCPGRSVLFFCKEIEGTEKKRLQFIHFCEQNAAKSQISTPYCLVFFQRLCALV